MGVVMVEMLVLKKFFCNMKLCFLLVCIILNSFIMVLGVLLEKIFRCFFGYRVCSCGRVRFFSSMWFSMVVCVGRWVLMLM